jgi:hypothetical protein
MARPRDWEHSLSAATRRSYEAEGRKRGMSASATRSYYENPSNNLAILRRHVTRSGASIPEGGIKEARNNPAKYRRYLDKHEPVSTGGGAPVDLPDLQDQAFRHHVSQLGEYFKYNSHTVELNAKGDPDNKEVYPGWSARECRLVLRSTAEQLRNLASRKIADNPFWYH